MKTQSDIYFYANKKKNGYVWQRKKLNHLRYGIQNPLTVISSYIYICSIENRIFYLCISCPIILDFSWRFTVRDSLQSRVKGREANGASYRSFRGLAWGRKFCRKDAVGDEKPTGRRNLARRQPPRGSYNDLKIPPSIRPPSFHAPQRAFRSRWRVSIRVSFSFSISFGVAHDGLGGAQLRLKTYDAVIFIAFRRLYAHLNFNARASRAARVNIAFFAETRTKTCVRCHPLSRGDRRRQNEK